MNPWMMGCVALGVLLAVTFPISTLGIHAAATGKARRGGKRGVRIPETLANDAAWRAGNRAADELRTVILLTELGPVAAGIICAFIDPWMSLLCLVLAIWLFAANSFWAVKVARQAALDAAEVEEADAESEIKASAWTRQPAAVGARAFGDVDAWDDEPTAGYSHGTSDEWEDEPAAGYSHDRSHGWAADDADGTPETAHDAQDLPTRRSRRRR